MSESANEVRKAFKVYGRVQGIGFRWWTRRQAHRLRLNGSVRNCFDGTVDVVIGGPAAAVHEMVELLKVGPAGAHVERLDELPGPDSLPDAFKILL